MTPAKKKVLLADDDASMRRFLQVILINENYDVVTADNGAAALQIATTDDFDAYVLDAIMPNLSGFDVARILKNNPSTKEIPLIILSGLTAKNNEPTDDIANCFIEKNTELKDELLSKLQILTEFN